MACGGGFPSHAAVGLLLLAGCGLDGDGLGSPGGDDAAQDASDAAAAADVQGETPTPDATMQPPPPQTVTITNTTVSSATGLAQQTHVVFAANAQLWWLFYWVAGTPSGAALQAMWSTDFVTWQPGSALQLMYDHAPVASGGDFSVYYANVAGTDVIHLTAGTKPQPNEYWRVHARATITGATIMFDPPQPASTTTVGGLDPDGCATTIDAQGYVWDASGWAPWMDGNMAGAEECWQSANADTASTWAPGFGQREDVAQPAAIIHARALVPTSGELLALWHDEAAGNIEADQWNGSAWTGGVQVFTNPMPTGYDDWGVVSAQTGVHVLRRRDDGSFEHASLSGTQWSASTAPDVRVAPLNSGLVLLAHGPTLLAAAIANDNSVGVSKYGGTSWTPWSTIEGPSSVPRTWLSGYSDGAGHAAVVWTQSDLKGGFLIVGRRVVF